MSCVFCRIISGELPAYVVHSDDLTISFLDINPVSRGHCLVLPREHLESFLDISRELNSILMNIISRVSRAVIGATGADSFNIFLNNGRSAGQIVPHVHFHVVPRFPSDSLYFKTVHRELPEEEMSGVREAIEGRLKAQDF